MKKISVETWLMADIIQLVDDYFDLINKLRFYQDVDRDELEKAMRELCIIRDELKLYDNRYNIVDRRQKKLSADDWLTVPEVSAITGLASPNIYKNIKRGIIECEMRETEYGRKKFIRWGSMVEYMEKYGRRRKNGFYNS